MVCVAERYTSVECTLSEEINEASFCCSGAATSSTAHCDNIDWGFPDLWNAKDCEETPTLICSDDYEEIANRNTGGNAVENFILQMPCSTPSEPNPQYEFSQIRA
jgi:hypothetical protein